MDSVCDFEKHAIPEYAKAKGSLCELVLRFRGPCLGHASVTDLSMSVHVDGRDMANLESSIVCSPM
jgi:hypothetical protein